MKLRNKKTGEIGNLVLNINPNRESYSVLSTENGDTICGNLVIADYDTLAQLNEEWKEYEESTNFWYIDDYGTMCGSVGESPNLEYSIYTKKQVEKLKAIGNYFETEEECEKAVEKLKAWTRLRKKGFKFTDYKLYRGSKIIDREFAISAESPVYVDHKDLDLLFGGEE